jgi:hypothetical protein
VRARACLTSNDKSHVKKLPATNASVPTNAKGQQ